jgi:hypothetical protein
MKKNMKARIGALVVAGTLLAGSLVVAAVQGSPYEVLKNAAFGALMYDNVTVEGEVAIIVNGQLFEMERISTQIGNGSQLSHGFDRWGAFNGLPSYHSEHFSITPIRNIEGWHSFRNHNPSWSNHQSSFSGMSQEDFSSTYFRFAELLLDLAVGNLKNNFYMINSGGTRTISATINHNQLPELARVGLELMIEQANITADWAYDNWDGLSSDWSSVPWAQRSRVTAINFDQIHITGDVDSDGHLTFIGGSIIMTMAIDNGRVDIVEISGGVNFTDIGTTVVVNPFYGIQYILTPDFVQQFGGQWARYGNIHFRTNPDGTVDTDSFTTQWPQNNRLEFNSTRH